MKEDHRTKTALLLCNLGTPEAPETAPVRRYLDEFLMDPYVVDIPAPLRWLLVRGLFLKGRPAKSAEAYRKIWTERGSPLLFHTLDLSSRVQEVLGDGWLVRPCMRYGEPSIESAVREVLDAGVDRVVFLPLYPQYSLAATESSTQKLREVMRRFGAEVPLNILGDFYADEGFVTAFADRGRRSVEANRGDFVLFSFHGLPERQVRKTDPSGAHCLASPECCARMTESNSKCYRAQCYESARQVAIRMELRADQWSVSFQSRLGRTPWIQPYTDFVYPELAKKGARRLVVMSPSFVADCLETLEEIEIRGREQFRECGGEDLFLVPSLNSEPAWVRAVAEMVERGGGL